MVAEIISLDSSGVRARVRVRPPQPCIRHNEEKYMMKMVARFSAWVVFAGLLCFAPSALGQGSVSVRVGAGNSVLNYAIPGFLTFNSHGRSEPDHKDGSGCSNQGQGRDSIVRDSKGWGGSSACKSVPEGGATFMYLALAGLCCLAAMALGSRRRGLRAKQTS